MTMTYIQQQYIIQAIGRNFFDGAVINTYLYTMRNTQQQSNTTPNGDVKCAQHAILAAERARQ